MEELKGKKIWAVLATYHFYMYAENGTLKHFDDNTEAYPFAIEADAREHAKTIVGKFVEDYREDGGSVKTEKKAEDSGTLTTIKRADNKIAAQYEVTIGTVTIN